MSYPSTARRLVATAATLATLGISGAALANPNLLGAWETENGVGLMWQNGDGNQVQSYRIYRRLGAAGYWQYIRGVAAGNALYVEEDTSAPAGQELCYAIGARITGQSRVRMSNARCVTPEGLPNQPSNVHLASVASDKVVVAWTDASDNETGFRVEAKRWGVDSSWRTVYASSGEPGTGSSMQVNDTNVAVEYNTCYRVGARSSVGTTIWAPIQCAVIPGWSFNPPAGNPLVITAMRHPGDGQIQVVWREATPNTTFTVHRRTIDAYGSSGWSTVATINEHRDPNQSWTMSHTDSGLDPNQAYCYQVRSSGYESHTVCSSAFDRSGGAAPAAPAASVNATGNREIELTYSVPSGAIGAFAMVYEKYENAPWRDYSAQSTAVGTHTVELDYLLNDTDYCVRVVSYNRYGIALSREVCARTLNVSPSRPQNFSVTGASDDRIVIDWDAADYADHYEVVWTGRKSAYVHKDGDTTTTSTGHTINGSSGYRYCVKVRAVNYVGASSWTAEECATATSSGGGGSSSPDIYWECGIGCDAGYHAQSYTRDETCPDLGGGDNKTQCVEDTAEFLQCDLPCPAGYHVEYYGDSPSCGDTSSSNWNNQTYCAINEGWFNLCGTSCPAGWEVTSETTSASCAYSKNSTSGDRVTCSPQ